MKHMKLNLQKPINMALFHLRLTLERKYQIPNLELYMNYKPHFFKINQLRA